MTETQFQKSVKKRIVAKLRIHKLYEISSVFGVFLFGSTNSSDCLLSDGKSSSSDGPVADKKAPGSERAAERAAQQNERIRLTPQSSFANMQVNHRKHNFLS